MKILNKLRKWWNSGFTCENCGRKLIGRGYNIRLPEKIRNKFSTDDLCFNCMNEAMVGYQTQWTIKKWRDKNYQGMVFVEELEGCIDTECMITDQEIEDLINDGFHEGIMELHGYATEYEEETDYYKATNKLVFYWRI